MAIGFVILGLLILALGLSQAWTVWYLRRQVARLDQRQDESLDDQDLLDFQERLQALLSQSKEAGADMVRTIQERQSALEKTLLLVMEAEKKLMARAQVMEKTANAVAERAEALKQPAARPRRAAVKSSAKAARPAKVTPVSQLRPAETAEKDASPEEPDTAAELADSEERNRSYLVRPASANAGAASPAPSRHQKIYDLSDQGLNRDQIAKEAGMLPGEIELILNLRPRRRGGA
jgi:hypothetical protein